MKHKHEKAYPLFDRPGLCIEIKDGYVVEGNRCWDVTGKEIMPVKGARLSQGQKGDKMMVKERFECLREWKALWDDPRGPGKLLIVGIATVLAAFFYMVILMVSRGG